ncbi:MAG: SpoIIE family protein phosphatase [Candidatus Krumholzibacteriota bacterium]|nr:SpoIIE family protein phosphatase [Candidatus Krumholzibacteriota bacterium]
MLSRIISKAVLVTGIALVLFAALFFTQESYRVIKRKSLGDVNTVLTEGQNGKFIFTSIDSLDYLSPPYPAIGDTLIQVADSLSGRGELSRLKLSSPPGLEIPIVYKSGEDTLRTVIKTVKVTAFSYSPLAILHFLRVLIAFSFAGVGFWAFMKRPDSGAVRALAMFCYSMTAFMVGAVNLGMHRIPAFTIPWMEYFFDAMGIIIVFVGAFWLNLQFLFPKPRLFVQKHPLITYLLTYVPIITILLLMALDAIKGELIIGLLVLVQIVTGFILLALYSRKTKDNLEKRQTRLVLWGTGTGVFLILFLMIVGNIANAWFRSQSQYLLMGIIIFTFLSLLLSPLSFAYAFGRYRLLEVEGKIKRGTRYAIVTGLLLAVFFALVYFISGALLSRIRVESRAIVPPVALLMAIGFTPAQRRVQRMLEDRIYPERNRLRLILRDFLTNAILVPDKAQFWQGLEARFREALKVTDVYPVIRAGSGKPMRHWSGEETPFMPDSSFGRGLLELMNRPMMVDEAIAAEKIELTAEELKWIMEKRIALVLPLVTHGTLIGFLAVGSKSEQSDFKSADMELIQSLSSQVAIATENIMLLEENIEKNRLENELNIARKVQEGLLPQSLPATPGLEVAGKSDSCLEIAGDYYDVINLDENLTVLAIGDVSGKGAGAAMLMSNLQASIRTAVKIGSNLKNIVDQINHLIYENTQAHQFITFFIGIYDRRTSLFSYVNAGHNSPYVVSRDGSVKLLEQGGLILGAVPDFSYELEQVKLEQGDLVFLYTDGLSEATDPDGEMFEEARIEKFIAANRDLPPGRLLEALEVEAGSFIRGNPMSDDLTLLAFKVLEA